MPKQENAYTLDENVKFCNQCFMKNKKKTPAVKRKKDSTRAGGVVGTVKRVRAQNILHYYPKNTQKPSSIKVIFEYHNPADNNVETKIATDGPHSSHGKE